jgi:Domain of unknown function DUF29
MLEGAASQAVELISFKEIPVFNSEQEEEDFWATHRLSNSLLEKMQPLEREPEPPSQYHHDFYAWTQTQAKALHDRRLDQLDLNNLIVEIEALGRQERRHLRHHIAELLTALITHHSQPKETQQALISQHRREIQLLLTENPSLTAALGSLLELAYETSRDLAVQETGKPYDSFPPACPYNLDQVLDKNFWG